MATKASRHGRDLSACRPYRGGNSCGGNALASSSSHYLFFVELLGSNLRNGPDSTGNSTAQSNSSDTVAGI
jgi:hypothetical protein